MSFPLVWHTARREPSAACHHKLSTVWNAVLLQRSGVTVIIHKWKWSGNHSIYRFLNFFFLISQDQDLMYSISAKALTHSVPWAPVLQQMRNQTLQHLSSLRLESEFEPHCSLLKPFAKQLNKWELFNVFNFLHFFQLYPSSKIWSFTKPSRDPTFWFSGIIL